MEGDNLRLEALENHVRRIERRLQRLETTRIADPAAPEPLAAAPSAPPPHPLALQAATPAPAAPAAAPAVASFPASPGWQSSTWWTSPEPKPTAPPARGAMTVTGSVPEPRTQGVPLPEVGDGWGRPAPTFAPDPATVSPTRPPISLKDLEERFAGRALAWVGGLALVAAAVFFLSLAFSRGWINEPMRVMIGLGVGIAAFAGGAVMLARHNRLMGNVLSAVGLGIISIALFAATRLYGLVSPEVGLAAALAAAIAAAVIAIRFDAKEVAAFGLIAALIAPPVVGASPTTLTLLFVAVTLVGTTAIALFRTWPYLPALAFILAAPQLASWLMGDPVPVQAIIALAGFWLINVVAAAGEEVRIRRDDLRPSSATLVLANATFLLWGGFVVLDGDLAGWFGTFIALASLAHLLLGGWFLVRQGFTHLFGNLVAGTGVALLAIAAFVQLGAAVVPLAWAAEAVALAWLAVRRRHKWSAAASLVLGGLVVAHLLVIEYPLWEAGLRATPVYSPPFLHPEAGSLGAVLAAIAVAVAVIPVRWIRSALAATGVVLAAYGVTFELAGPSLAAALTGLALAGLLLDRLIERLPVSDGLEPVAGWVPGGWLASSSSLFAGGLAVLLLFVTEYPPSWLGEVSGTPFVSPEGASLALVLAGLTAAGALVGVRWIRSAMAGIGILLVAWAAGSEVEGTGLVGLLALLAVVGLLMDRLIERLPVGDRFAPLVGLVNGDWLASLTSLVTGGLAILLVVVTEYPPSGLGDVSGTPFINPAGASLALVLAGLTAAGALVGVRWIRSALAGIGILLVAWAAGSEVEGTGLVGLLALLLPIGVIIDRGLGRLPEDERYASLQPVFPFGQLAGAAGVIAWASALVFALSRYLNPITWGSVTPPPVPFADDRALAAVLLAASALAAARWTGSAVARRAGVIAAVLIAALLVPFEVYADWVVVLWVALAVMMLAIARLDAAGARAYTLVGIGLWTGGAAVAYGIVAQPSRLWVEDGRAAMLPGWALSFAAVAVGLLVAARQVVFARWRAWLEVGAGFTSLYLVSVGIVAMFEGLIGGSTPVEELSKQAQVALSVCWTAIGASLLVAGLVRRRPMLRHGGFALLGIATIKVFVIDLAAMDVAYRALVLAGLGVLLLGSAFLFTHFRGPRSGAAGVTGGPQAVT